MTLQLNTLSLSICQVTYVYILQTSTQSYVNELKFKFTLSYTMDYHILLCWRVIMLSLKSILSNHFISAGLNFIGSKIIIYDGRRNKNTRLALKHMRAF